MQLAEAALLRSTQAEFPVLGAGGKLVGVLTKAAIVANAKDKNPNKDVGAFMATDIPEVALTTPLEEVLEQLQRADIPVVAVTDQGGHFVGYVTRENIGEWMVLNQSRSA